MKWKTSKDLLIILISLFILQSFKKEGSIGLEDQLNESGKHKGQKFLITGGNMQMLPKELTGKNITFKQLKHLGEDLKKSMHNITRFDFSKKGTENKER